MDTMTGLYMPPATNAGQIWTREEVRALPILHHQYGPLGYKTPFGLPDLFFQMTGRHRDHHAIYMAWTRYLKGTYDHYLTDLES